jgi:hypothetical protein
MLEISETSSLMATVLRRWTSATRSFLSVAPTASLGKPLHHRSLGMYADTLPFQPSGGCSRGEWRVPQSATIQ